MNERDESFLLRVVVLVCAAMLLMLVGQCGSCMERSGERSKIFEQRQTREMELKHEQQMELIRRRQCEESSDQRARLGAGG